MDLPCVEWGGHSISRLLIGHNPIKGQSHFSGEMDADMRSWFAPGSGEDLATLARCEACGINTAQFGGPPMHSLLERYESAGGHMQWIATLYGNETGDLGVGDRIAMKEELAETLAVNPPPIGIQHFGEHTDQLFFKGRLEDVRERMKVLRDTGVLIGVGTHLAQVAEEIASQDWDIDFYQTCFFSVYSHVEEGGIDRTRERFDDEDRDRVVRFITSVDKPCLAFKVLAANRKCRSEESVHVALRFAFESIKDTDVVLVGMWQRYRDQVGQNAQWTREILGALKK